MKKIPQKRILLVDDNPEIHKDLFKILNFNNHETALDEDEAILLGETPYKDLKRVKLEYKIDSAFQGQEGLFYSPYLNQ